MGQVSLPRNDRARAAVLLLALVASGCSDIERFNDSKLTIETPIDWWHDLQGGKIADLRPPPPGVTDPYPNLGQVPARPTPTDATTRRALAARLAAQRDLTQREATQDPLVLPVPPGGTPAPATPVPATSVPARPARPAVPPDPGASVAVMDAATAPPARAASSTPAPAEVAPAATTPRTPVASGPLPELPAAAPPLPQLAGMPATVSAPATPRVPPGVTIAFPPGSAALPDAAGQALRELAGRRAGASIAVTAGGDSAGGSALQASALPLALRRVRAMQDALVAAGVPAEALRVDAVAPGRGGTARLIQ